MNAQANPADIVSIDAIVRAAYDVISGPAGARDWERERSLFWPGARLIPTGQPNAGPIAPQILDVEGFIRRVEPFFETTGFYEYEFVAIGVLMIQGQGDLQREFLRAYGYKDPEITEELRRRLMLLTILYEHSSLRRYAERLGPGSEKLPLEELEKAIWNFI